MGHFFTITSELPRLGLNIYELGVYVMLSSHVGNASRKAYPSVATLARECGISAGSVRKAIRSLCERGLITSEENYTLLPSGARARSSNIYTITKVQPTSAKSGEPLKAASFDYDDFFEAALRAARRDGD